MFSMIADSLNQLLVTHCTGKFIRSLESCLQRDSYVDRREGWLPLWNELEAAGFANALLPEGQGGVGLGLDVGYVIAEQCGQAALPVPLVHTALIRAALSTTGDEFPEGAITLADQAWADGQGVLANVPFGLTADWVLVPDGDLSLLLPIAAATVVSRPSDSSTDAALRWNNRDLARLTGINVSLLRLLGACANAGLLAGALTKVMELTVQYAGERSQFGKPIARLQAIQQQLSVMAEEVYLARTAAQLAFAADTTGRDSGVYEELRARVATAKCQTSTAAAKVTAIAHAVHGAIGFTEEHVLQQFTRRLHEWRLGYGAESYWAKQLAGLVLDGSGKAVDVILENTAVMTAED